jgi:hypothetical protein
MAMNPENDAQKGPAAGAAAQQGVSRGNGQGSAGTTHAGGGNGHDTSARVSGERQSILSGIQQTVSSKADSQKNRAAEGIAGIADVIRNAGNELRSQNESLASLVDGASDQLKSFADRIRQRGTGDIVKDIAEFGRRQPGLFLGGAFLIGLGAARFLKSSSHDVDDDDRSYAGFTTSTTSSRTQPSAGGYGDTFSGR